MYVMYVCMYVCIYVCMCVCMYVCMYVCTYVCMYVCIHVYVYVSSAGADARPRFDKYEKYVCMYTYSHVCMYVHTYVYVQSQLIQFRPHALTRAYLLRDFDRYVTLQRISPRPYTPPLYWPARDPRVYFVSRVKQFDRETSDSVSESVYTGRICDKSCIYKQWAYMTDSIPSLLSGTWSIHAVNRWG